MPPMSAQTEPVVEELDGLRLVSDPEDDGRPDLVQGVTAAARTLAHLLVPRRVGTALDLGTGCGVLALLMARHADRVVATDINARALEFGRRSARLSGIANVEWREGDWYAPVQGERFDLIACNPPYVISPETRLVYRDGSDATPGVVRGAGEHLAPGGLAQLLVNWAHPPADWAGPLRSWIPAGCDGLVVHHASMRPRQYAETWVPDGAGREERIATWLAWYAERDIAAIGAAFLLLRRREDDGPPRLQALEADTPATPRAGMHVERILRGTDVAARADAELLATALRIPDGVRVEQTTRRRSGAWVGEDAVLRCVPTVGVQTTVPAEQVPLLWTFDGTTRLGADALPLARRLLELGFAEPAEPA